MTITWCMVPEIWSVTDKIFCHFWPIFAPIPPYEPRKSKFWKHENNTWRYYHFTHVYHKWQSHDVWFLRHEAWQTEFFIILDPFLPFYPPNNTKNQNLKKLKKTHEDTIVLHMYGIYDNHMMYGSWDKEHGRQNLLSLWTVFCPYTPLWTQKIKILKTWK